MNNTSLSTRWLFGILLLGLLSISVLLPAPGQPQPRGTSLGLKNDYFAAFEDDTANTEQNEEELLKDWTQPEFALFVTGRQHGYIEPCGCTGLDNQNGGMMRRHTALKQVKALGWDVIPIDIGNQVRRFGAQPVIKLKHTWESLCQIMDYKAVGLGPDDLKLSAVDLLQTIENAKKDDSSNIFVCANAVVLDQSFTTRFLIIPTKSGKKVGVTYIVGDEEVKEINNSEITFQPTEDALTEVVPKMQEAGCDTMVLMCKSSLEDCRAIAKKFPVFDLLVTGGGAGEPTFRPEMVKAGEHTTQMIQVGTKGMYAGVVGFYPGKENPIRYERITLSSRFEDSEEIKVVFKNYQNELKAMGLERLGLKPVKHPADRQFVGSRVCADCHSTAYKIWKDGVDGQGGPHFRATLDLTEPGERTWVKRHHDPECLSCHVTGWHPQEYFPYQSGYLKLEDNLLHGNGCENCHGPAGRHVAAENGDIDVSIEEMENLRKELVVTKDEAKKEMCMSCHDIDNSPDFHEDGAFEEYWKKIEHYGKD